MRKLDTSSQPHPLPSLPFPPSPPPPPSDVLQRDMGQGLPFRAACFDGAVSISALQWLCYEDSKAQSANARLMRFFASLYTVLRRGARAALQFYPGTVVLPFP